MPFLSNAPIGLFDSGVGGLSVANAIHHLLPDETICYVADSAYAPYGNKTPDFVLKRARIITEFLLDKGCKIIVLACNTATLSCVAKLREEYRIPFVGVEPGIKPAVAASKVNKVGVLATTLTIQSAQYQALLSKVAGNSEVFSQPCKGLARQIEKGQFESQETLALLEQYVEALLAEGVDQIVLGCTHYDFVRNQISRIVDGRADIVSTAPAVARQVKNLLEEHASLADAQHGLKDRIWTSGNIETIQPIIDMLWQGTQAQFDVLNQ